MVIVSGYSERPEGLAALEAAMDEAAQWGAELHVVQVMREAATPDRGRVENWNARLEEARGRGEQIEQQLATRGLEGSFELRTGQEALARQFLDVARQKDADRIIIGLRRRSAVGKLIMGSTGQDILLHAPCPVLAVYAPQDHE